MTPTRPESLRDDLATIIQSGTVARKTSDEIAAEVIDALLVRAVMAQPLSAELDASFYPKP